MADENQILKIDSMTKFKRYKMHKQVQGCWTTYANSMYPLPALAADKIAAWAPAVDTESWPKGRGFFRSPSTYNSLEFSKHNDEGHWSCICIFLDKYLIPFWFFVLPTTIAINRICSRRHQLHTTCSCSRAAYAKSQHRSTIRKEHIILITGFKEKASALHK